MRPSLKKSVQTFLLLTVSVIVLAQKTDKVFLKNGDVVTGEIKSMKLAKLNFDMNGPGMISIKWEEIIRVTSIKTFQVTLKDGQIFLTKFDTLFFVKHDVTPDDIVEIVQVRKRFLKRLEGSLNMGFSYTKSSDIGQFNFNSSITYRIPKVETNLTLNTVISRSSDDTITSKKQDATISHLRTLNRRFYLMGTFGWEQNTQLGLDNRFLLGAGAGKIIFIDNHQRLLSGIGLSYNDEQFKESSEYKNSVEALAMVQFKKFRYSAPKVNIDALYILYPSLSDWGRIRMNLSITTSLEIFKDFLVGLTFYDNYDNRPSSDAASTNDYGITFTFGYTFGK